MVRLYIADMDAAFVRTIRKVIARSHAVEVVGEASNGAKALSDIQRLQPDVVLTDIPLPELDGIALLRETRRMRRAPSVIVCTRFYPAVCLDMCFRFGAAYFLCKPIDPERLPELVTACAGSRTVQPPAEDVPSDPGGANVQALLAEMGISARLNGSAYLVKAVLWARENELLLRNLSHGLYLELATRMGTTVSRVERSVRSAITVAYERGSLRQRFPQKPTNRQFIEFLLRETE